MLLNLSARTADDPRSFVGAGYTWQGQRSIDSRLTSLFGLEDGRTVAVAASDDLLTQFVTPLAGGEVDVTVTLSDHGSRTLRGPAQEETAEAAETSDRSRIDLAAAPSSGPLKLGAVLGTSRNKRERAISSPDRPLPGYFLPDPERSGHPQLAWDLPGPSRAPPAGPSGGP